MTLLLAGVPAALYERFKGERRARRRALHLVRGHALLSMHGLMAAAGG